MMIHPSLAAATAAVSSSHVSPPQVPASPPARRRSGGFAVRCAPDGAGDTSAGNTNAKLKVGSPIVILEAPAMLKTAASVPSLRYNSGQVKAGDVGRIVARKPKDVWAVRLAVGAYLLDGKFFRPLEVDEGVDESPDE
ncbi:hypothetical protein ACP70R_012471 [Stipagrostis hirtigluma subsp. patula]